MDDIIRWPGDEQATLDTKLQRAQSLVGSSKGRPEEDFYPTPPNATEALLSVEKFSGDIWEPACGDGAICKVLEAHGHTVIATDLIDRGWGKGGQDFFASDLSAANIITNPPYKFGEDFVRHALTKTTGKVAMLMKLAFLEGAKRKQMYESTPIKSVHVFSKRLTMYRNGEKSGYSSGMIPFCWIVWEHGYTGQPTISWL